MAEFAETGDPTQLYTAIEKAYCEDRWPDVLDQGEKLLSRLASDDLGLRQRLQLLMAHTYLYGYGDRDSAEDLYRAVLESKAEVALRQIAAQGLQQCDLPPERLPQSGAGAAAPVAQTPAREPHPPLDPDQLPQPVGAPALEEPDGPSLHDSVQAFTPQTPDVTPPASGFTAPAPSSPELPSRPQDLPPAPIADIGAVAAAPAMPWLQEATGAPADAGTDAGATPPWAAPEPQPAAWPGESAPDEGIPGAEGGAMGLLAVDAGDAAMPPLLTVDVTEPRGEVTLESLVPDVIDEPELIEVHQADPTLAEEFELREAPAPADLAAREAEPADSAAEPEPPAQEEDPELLQGLLRVEIL